MSTTNEIDRFHELRETHDEIFGPGSTLELKDELELGTGRFNEELTTEEILELNQELEDRLAEIQ